MTGTDAGAGPVGDAGAPVLDASRISLAQLASLDDTVLADALRRIRAAVDRDGSPVAGFNSAI